ncbi:branched-chain amino acid transport system permease protein [Enhydrobacter aerosaccus]|uniref:Branched-chain amino acid transport system permease protein n=1 Tax=Enhydrobacter aerosaccus TaxID=225324 RepID=A0A1T4TFX2_9HYPH|nr:branched-chain amino acid ABC transporter permease [Enhydrobacter aerosaccus]SKA39350.1 branched-chain amino acid transport system permease protein [Enhydrobacter aerosaccus]
MSASFRFPPSFHRSVIAILVTVALFALAPLVAGDFALHVLTIGFYYVILASSWNLLAGYTGQFSLAHHAFAAVGAYTSGLLGYHLGAPAWIGIPAGVVLAALFGLVLGRLVLRMRAIYLAIATWAFAETVHIYLTADYQFTRGELGLSVKPLYSTIGPLPYYFTFLALAAVVLIGLRALIDSPLGYFMRAIKDNELRAKSLGIDTTRVKIAVFSISSAVAGLAGAFYGHFIGLLSPQMIDFSEMAKIVIMVVIGGFGTFLGPVIGAAPVQIVMTYLQKYGEWNLAVFALIVIVLMRFSMEGLASLFAPVWRRLWARDHG